MLFIDTGYNCIPGKITLQAMSVDVVSIIDPCTLLRAISFIEGVQDIEMISELDQDAGLMQQTINRFATSLMELKIKQKGNHYHTLPSRKYAQSGFLSLSLFFLSFYVVVTKPLWTSSVLYMNQLTSLKRLYIECLDEELKSLTASISTIAPHQL